MKRLKTIEGRVKDILLHNEKARDDDMTLYVCVCRSCVPDIATLPFETVMLNYKSFGVPNLESVGRARRKLQEKHPELIGSARVQKLRAEQEKVYRQYAKE